MGVSDTPPSNSNGDGFNLRAIAHSFYGACNLLLGGEVPPPSASTTPSPTIIGVGYGPDRRRLGGGGGDDYYGGHHDDGYSDDDAYHVSLTFV